MRRDMNSALVRLLLEKWEFHNWTVQGFGMVRVKIADVGRIHLWDSRLRVPLVSDIHAHPWDLRSRVISGELINQRFSTSWTDDCSEDDDPLPYMRQTIATGEGGGLRGEPDELKLYPMRPEFYTRGQAYSQSATEIHRSIPIDGTVTLMERPLGPPLQETDVYWPRGLSWVSAEPRPAERYEIQNAVGLALARWDSR